MLTSSSARILMMTALAPMIWGSTFIVTTEALAGYPPMLIAMLRALPAGLLLLLVCRQLPPRPLVGKLLVLGALNFSIFWGMLFVSAYRLPGGVAATLGAIQPFAALFLARILLDAPIRAVSVIAACGGVLGVALLLLTPEATLDTTGILAGLIGAVSMAAGVVLTKKWLPGIAPITSTAWQLTAGGLLLVPVALLTTPGLPQITALNVAGITYLCLIGGVFTYILWFRGIGQLDPGAVSLLALLSPLAAVILGWTLKGEALTPSQMVGALIIVFSVGLGQVRTPLLRLPARVRA